MTNIHILFLETAFGIRTLIKVDEAITYRTANKLIYKLEIKIVVNIFVKYFLEKVEVLNIFKYILNHEKWIVFFFLLNLYNSKFLHI